MNATLHLPNMHSARQNQPVRLFNIVTALLITLRGLLGPDEEAADDSAANATFRQKYGAAGD
jgi:hypothetical protein